MPRTLPNGGRTHEPSLREVVIQLDDFKELMAERDRRYEERFAAQSAAVEKALQASKALTDAAFTASEKAIAKAEMAQAEYNVRSNEFRGQLADQAKMLMPRAEVLTRWATYDEKFDDMKKELQSLRESRSETHGEHQATQWLGSLLAGLASGVMVAAATYLAHH